MILLTKISFILFDNESILLEKSIHLDQCRVKICLWLGGEKGSRPKTGIISDDVCDDECKTLSQKKNSRDVKQHPLV